MQEGPWNLKIFAPIRWLALNYHLHLAHHQHTDAPWTELPSHVPAGSYTPSFWSIYLSLWGGVRPAPPMGAPGNRRWVRPATPTSSSTMKPDPARITAYALWSTVAGGVFFAIYPTINRFTASRLHTHRCYFEWELDTPFLPQFIWVYLSMYLLFLAPLLWLEPPAIRAVGKQLTAGTLASGALFLLFPASLGFPRVIDDNPSLAWIYQKMFGIDPPHNLVPSLHLVWSGTITMALRENTGSWGRWIFPAWLTAIAVSTMLVHQHHLADVAGGLAMVAVLRKIIPIKQP